jgi:hypothetical protein
MDASDEQQDQNKQKNAQGNHDRVGGIRVLDLA